MRWGSKAKHGESRVIKKFAWLPIRINSRWSDKPIQWGWLELVKIEQEYRTSSDDDISLIADIKVWLFGGYWKNKRFLEFDLSEKRDEKLKKLGI